MCDNIYFFFLIKCIFIYLLFTFFFKFATMKLCSEYETQSKTSKNYFQNRRMTFKCKVFIDMYNKTDLIYV